MAGGGPVPQKRGAKGRSYCLIVITKDLASPPCLSPDLLSSVLVSRFGCWQSYLIDEWNGGRPAGTEKWIKEGMLELPSTIAASEQGILQGESYPVGCMVQNMRLACEAMGLGAWG